MMSTASKNLQTFENPQPDRDYTINMDIPEFTCLCPMTGQPDFATLNIRYVPARLCIELKSLKCYVQSFRDQGAFHEAVTNQIFSDIVSVLNPCYMKLTADFNVRGGICTSIVVEHRKAGWQSPEPVTLP